MLQLLCQELHALLSAGLALTESLATLHAKERRPAQRELLAALLGGLREGRNFSDVLARYPQHFPEVLVATVRASERTGDLAPALARFIVYQQQFEDIRKKLISAAIYPAMLLLVGAFVTLFLVGYVVPKFASAYESAGRDLPWLSQAMLTVGQFIHGHASWFFGAVLVLVVGAVLLARDPAVRARVLDRATRLPVIAEKVDEFRLARFYRALGLLLTAGIPLARALPMVTGLLTLSQQQRLALARRQVEEGKPLSVALGAQALVTPVADSLIRVGESSGRLAEMLERTARFHDEDFARWVDWMSKLLEPALMALIGLIIGTIVVLMYIPIFELAGSLQ